MQRAECGNHSACYLLRHGHYVCHNAVIERIMFDIRTNRLHDGLKTRAGLMRCAQIDAFRAMLIFCGSEQEQASNKPQPL